MDFSVTRLSWIDVQVERRVLIILCYVMWTWLDTSSSGARTDYWATYERQHTSFRVTCSAALLRHNHSMHFGISHFLYRGQLAMPAFPPYVDQITGKLFVVTRIMKLIKCDMLEQYVACGSFCAEKCKQKFVAELGVKIKQRIQWRLLP
jgi:hypothetical protein